MYNCTSVFWHPHFDDLEAKESIRKTEAAEEFARARTKKGAK
jgi:hypothetical protein